MDLLQTVRKEGSRGGVDFKWDDVKTSIHRENYLGHSLMAPVGRWQKGKDLNWYAREGEETNEEDEAQRRKDELRKVKEAEEDAMALALGLPVPDRSANTEPLGERPQLKDGDEPRKQVKEAESEKIHRRSDRTEKERRRHRHHHSRERRHSRERKRTRSPRDQPHRPRRHERSRSRSRRRSYSREAAPRRRSPDGERHERTERSHRHKSRSPYRKERERRSYDDDRRRYDR